MKRSQFTTRPVARRLLPSKPAWNNAAFSRRMCFFLLPRAGILAFLLLIISMWQNLGVGIAPPGSSVAWGCDKAICEVSMVRGGLLFVFNGTRTDSLIYDHSNGFSQFGGHIYVLDVHTVAGRIIWWPRIEQPAPGCGPYVFMPLWPVVLGCTFGAWRLRPRPDKNACKSCGYSRSGLPPGAPCPECGAATTD
ncbi:MAG: hypothetical protein H7210_12545 [Pyrinomonadaceae bacterium]|nr:hypothetical protein [Phycisphaerales bacterium]